MGESGGTDDRGAADRTADQKMVQSKLTGTT